MYVTEIDVALLCRTNTWERSGMRREEINLGRGQGWVFSSHQGYGFSDDDAFRPRLCSMRLTQPCAVHAGHARLRDRVPTSQRS